MGSDDGPSLGTYRAMRDFSRTPEPAGTDAVAAGELDLAGPSWQAPRHHVGDGRALLVAAARQALPGVVAKRLDSRYRPGEVTREWRRVRATGSDIGENPLIADK